MAINKPFSRFCFRATFGGLIVFFLFLATHNHSFLHLQYFSVQQNAVDYSDFTLLKQRDNEKKSPEIKKRRSEGKPAKSSSSQEATEPKATALNLPPFDLTCPSEEENDKFINELKKERLVPAETHLGAGSFFTHKKNQKLGYCVNLKSGYTLLTLIFGYLSDAKMCNIDEKWSEKLVTRCNRMKTKRNIVTRRIAEKDAWTILSIVRDPINRFISGWLDRCVHRIWGKKDKRNDYCSKCGKDIGCFVAKHYDILLGYVNKTKKLSSTFDGGHFWPQSWICPLRPNLKTELIKLGRGEKFFSSLKLVLSGNKGVSEDQLSHIMKSVRGQTTAHTRFGGPEWQNVVDTLRKNPEIYRTLLKMYYSDYEHFGVFKIQSSFECWLSSNEEILRR